MFVRTRQLGTLAGATLSFRNLTTGNTSILYIGDDWQIDITGAAPNAAVTMNGGSYGMTDAAGNFSLSGTTSIAPGSYTETWYVNGAQVGSQLSFSVANQPATPQTFAVAFTDANGNPYALSAVPAGASWQIRITGATPNAPAWLVSNGATIQLGSTDNTGSLGWASQAGGNGQYNTTVYVNGSLIGSYSVTMIAAATTTPATTNQSQNTSATDAQTTVVNTPITETTPIAQMADAAAQVQQTVKAAITKAAEYPWYLWAGLAIAVVLMARSKE
jgi:hypothetical protein